MTVRDGIFAGDTPHLILERWMQEAAASEPADPNAMALATVDEHGMPDVRIVLMKGVSAEGVEFFTNYNSQKGQQLQSAGKAAVNFHWKGLKRQIRIRGRVEKTSADTSDAYYATRPLGSRIGAWASRQSQPLESRDALIAQVKDAQAAHGETPARPAHWGGFLLRPTEYEFWADAEYRLHDRFRWRLDDRAGKWAISRLNP